MENNIELIKNFSKIRDYMRDFFINGYKVRNDFSGKSLRTFDDEKRRVKSWLGDHVKDYDSDKGRIVSILIDSGHISANPLYQAYYSCSFTDKDIYLHFYLIGLLSDGEWRSLSEICDALDLPIDAQTVRNKLREYVKEGIFLTEKRGNAAFFRISPHTAEELIKKFPGFDEALKFFSCSQEFGVVGSTIMNGADLENDHFLMKHDFLVHTLDDEIVLKLIEAIEEKRAVRISSFGRSGKISEQGKIVVPMQILSSLQTGRRYAAVWDAESRRFSSLRIDYIKDVMKTDVCVEFDELHGEYLNISSRSFGVALGSRNSSISPLRITVQLDEETEPFILKRLKREKRCGVLEKSGKGRYTVVLDINDPNEAMHWVKSFIGRIVSVEGGTVEIRETFLKDIRDMAEMYGGGI